MKLLPFIFVLSVAASVRADWAREEEVPLVIKKLERITHVMKDGTSRETWTWHLLIRKTNAKEEAGTRTIPFYEGMEKVKVLFARTKTAGRSTEISVADLQERGAADENPGFSNLHEYVLSFPDVKEGSELEYSYEVTLLKAPEPGFWGQNMIFAAGNYRAFLWDIISDRPLYHSVQDPTGSLAAKSSQSGSEYRLTIRARKPFSRDLVDPQPVFVGNSKKIVVSVGVLKDWKDYGVGSAQKFEELATAPLVKDELALMKKIAGYDDDRKIDAILSFVRGKLRYFGDFRSSERLFVPKPLAEIRRAGYGDCKDYALYSTSLFRAAGFGAEPAWILNEEDAPPKALYALPTDNAFNHVIVRVSKGAEIRWIDPTNPLARSRFMADEIAARPGFVLGPRKGELQDLPAIKSEQYSGSSTTEFEEKGGGLIRVRSDLRFENFSRSQAGQDLEEMGSGAFAADRLSRVLPLGSLIRVSPEIRVERNGETGDLSRLMLDATYHSLWVQSTLGPGLQLPRDESVTHLKTANFEQRAGDFLLGKPYRYQTNFLVRGKKIKGTRTLDCEVTSRWFDFKQRVFTDKDGLRVEVLTDLKEPVIEWLPETKNDVMALQRSLRECAGEQVVLFAE